MGGAGGGGQSRRVHGHTVSAAGRGGVVAVVASGQAASVTRNPVVATREQGLQGNGGCAKPV